MNAIVELSGVPGAMECLDATEKRILRLIEKSDDESYVKAMATFLQQLQAVRLQILKPSMSDQRSTVRAQESGIALIRCGNGPLYEAAMRDISVGGAFLEADMEVKAGDHVRLYLPGFEDEIGAEVRGSRGKGIHLAFDHLEPDAAVALLKRLERHFSRY